MRQVTTASSRSYSIAIMVKAFSCIGRDSSQLSLWLSCFGYPAAHHRHHLHGSSAHLDQAQQQQFVMVSFLAAVSNIRNGSCTFSRPSQISVTAQTAASFRFGHPAARHRHHLHGSSARLDQAQQPQFVMVSFLAAVSNIRNDSCISSPSQISVTAQTAASARFGHPAAYYWHRLHGSSARLDQQQQPQFVKVPFPATVSSIRNGSRIF